MNQTVVAPDEMVRMDPSDFDDVEREMCSSDREVACGFVPFANLDMMGVLVAARSASRTRERLPPSRMTRLVRCPECDGGNLISVMAGRKMNVFCQDCTRCWHIHGDEVTRVNPWMCPGCELVTTACFERFEMSAAAAP
jgi:hypothetical protein